MELIKIKKSDGGNDVISAKELFIFLGYDKSHWKRWYETNIISNTFAIENQDYQGFATMANGNETKDFLITLDFAKRLSMMAKTEKGETARKYFIDCEKKLKEVSTPKELSRKEILLLALEAEERAEKAEKLLEQQAPKVEYYDQIIDSKDAISIGEVARVLNIGIGQNKLFNFLRERKILMHNNLPYQNYIDKGWFRTVEQKYKDSKGNIKINTKTLVYQKGIEGILKMFQV